MALDPTFRSNYLFNSRIQGIEDADVILLVGVNPRVEAPVLNARILKATRKYGTKVYVVGGGSDLTYDFKHVGLSPNVLSQLSDGTHPLAAELKNAKMPMVIVGRDALTRSDSPAILEGLKKLAIGNGYVNNTTGWNGFNVLHRNTGEINALELGLDLRKKIDNPKILFLLGCDNWISPEDVPKDAFVVYIGTHGDYGAQYADVILPAAAYTEKSGIHGTNSRNFSQYGGKSSDDVEGCSATRPCQIIMDNFQSIVRGMRRNTPIRHKRRVESQIV